MTDITPVLILSAILFCISIAGVFINRKNIILFVDVYRVDVAVG